MRGASFFPGARNKDDPCDVSGKNIVCFFEAHATSSFSLLPADLFFFFFFLPLFRVLILVSIDLFLFLNIYKKSFWNFAWLRTMFCSLDALAVLLLLAVCCKSQPNQASQIKWFVNELLIYSLFSSVNLQ